jgi:hypothetical protein
MLKGGNMATLNIKSFPEELYHILAKKAKKDRRSLTGEVIYLLEWAIEASSKERPSILQLRGLGKEHWEDINVTKHIDSERESWE